MADDRPEWEVLQGDSAEVLRTLSGPFHSMVTDPPAGIGFMGKSWDKDRGGRDLWVQWLSGVLQSARRVLLPGAHCLVWALPRTAHWTMIALENAGYEIRDVIVHLFGTGFPKSLDVSKAIDERLGAEREPVSPIPVPAGNRDGTLALGGGWQDTPMVTAPGSPEAQEWEGWGTCLKPAAEHWIVARVPLDGTVAHNVLSHGAGGINVDGCRIGTETVKTYVRWSDRHADGQTMHGGWSGQVDESERTGRWPANVCLSHNHDCTESECTEGCAAAHLDSQSGVTRSKSGGTSGLQDLYVGGRIEKPVPRTGHDDSGGASRFFYQAKPGKGERDAGLDSLDLHSAGQVTGGRREGSAGLDSPRAGAGRTSGARNVHPTVKSIDLMKWLVRLVTPPGGRVLDPFCGSGSTGCACILEGLSFTGIEYSEEYARIARLRIGHTEAHSRAVLLRDGTRVVVEGKGSRRRVSASQAPLFAMMDGED